MTKEKYYVIRKGRKTGIFNTWDECKEQVEGFKGAQHKSFNSRALAEQWFKSKKESKLIGDPILESISVDAACSGNPGDLEYRGVYTKTRKELFRQGPFSEGTNNIGEFLAIVYALVYLKKKNSKIPIYSDSNVAILWVKSKEIRTRLKRNKKNRKLFESLERAKDRLNENKYENEILKWETEAWGEIPADFGRKR